ncbi:hypothetical protein Tco_1136536 [Tanacetum coccineum]
MLNIFESMEQQVKEKSPIKNILQNEIDRLLEVSLTSEIRDYVLLSVKKQKNKLLKDGLKKSSSDSKDIQANLLKRIKILENNFKRSQAQSINVELKSQHQKEKMACDVSWKSKLSTLNDENVLLKTQVEYVVQERENIKLEFQKLFNFIKATRTQNQKEVDELIEHVNQKTYAYADVRAQNQDLLMTISKLKNKLRTIEKWKYVNTKFEKSETLGKLVCVTPFNKNLGNKANNVSNTKVKTDRSKSVTSHPTPKNKQSKKQSVNVIARGMYRITKSETQTPDSKTNIHVSNSTCVESSNSISLSVSIDSNKCETKDSNVCQTNASVSNSKTVNVVNDGSNIVCVSCGKDVFLLSHEKCVARYALSRKSNVKRALFTNPVTAKSKNLGTTYAVVKSRLSVTKTSKATNKVFSASSLSHDSSQSKTLSNYIKNKIATSLKWQRWFEYQQSFNWSPKSKTAQSLPSEKRVVIQVVLWIVDNGCSKHMTSNLQLLRNFIEKFIGTVRFGNKHFAAITRYGDYIQGNLTICHIYYVEGLGQNLFRSDNFVMEI